MVGLLRIGWEMWSEQVVESSCMSIRRVPTSASGEETTGLVKGLDCFFLVLMVFFFFCARPCEIFFKVWVLIWELKIKKFEVFSLVLFLGCDITTFVMT